MTFDYTLNVGHVLTIVGLLVAGIGAWAKTQARLAVMETKIDHLNDAVHQLQEQVARLR